MKRISTLALVAVCITVPVSIVSATESFRESEYRHHQSVLSSLWAFASLNYLYCDVAGLMDAEMLSEYLAGEVDGVEMDDGFLLAATILMEVPMSMVFLSHVLEPRALRIAGLSAGALMTAVQSATLFVGKPSSYYLFSSIVEIVTTSFITVYTWKNVAPRRVEPLVTMGGDTFGVALRVKL